MVEIAYF